MTLFDKFKRYSPEYVEDKSTPANFGDTRLDRKVKFDERSRNYSIRELLDPTALKTKTWASTYWLDQGNQGACVGFGWSHELGARPVVVPVDYTYAVNLYREAQKIDDTPGENYSGTSVLAGAKVVQSSGYMPEYRWAFSVEDMVGALGQHGPVVLGVTWHEDMYNVNESGYLVPTGPVVGGHCIMARGVHLRFKSKTDRSYLNVDLDKSFVLLRNSWGKDWGLNGEARMSLSDLTKLMAEDGECCIPVSRVKP